MKDKIHILLLSAVFPVLVVACKKPQRYSEIPAIRFESIALKDSIDPLDNPVTGAVLCFSFVDGDGDLGLDQGDTAPPFNPAGDYYNNLLIDTYKKTDGVFQKVDLASPLYFRFPDVSAHGQNKTIKGRILTRFSYNLNIDTLFNAGDTLRYVFFIYDKALHQSNSETTTEVILTQ